MLDDDFDDLDGLVHERDHDDRLHYSTTAKGYVEVPDNLDGAIAAAMAELAEASTTATELVYLGDGGSDEPDSAGSALVATGGNAALVKQRMAERRAAIVRSRQQVARATKKVKVLVEIKKEHLDRLTRELTEVMAPLQEQVALLEEGIWTINLYTGRDEGIVVLRDGERAPADEEIAVRQMVLFMDEESLAALDSGGVDFNKIEQFDEWLLANPAHIEQVIPHRKGVVVLEPRRTTFKRYETIYEEMAANRANHQSYWLIRNGDCLFRMTTDIAVGHVLVPTADEFTSFFQTTEYDWKTSERRTVPLRPGSDAWMRAEKAAGARQRHFMRVALIMQGLVDRSTVLHPVPPDLSFLEPHSYDAGHVSVVTDAERLLGTGSVPFYEWLRDRNEQLRIGMRVVGAFGSAYSERNGEYRVSPSGADNPESLVLHRLEQTTSDGGFKFLFERQERWRRYDKRASYIIYPDDKFVLPFDLVTVEEMEWYLASRTERHGYLAMVPLLRAAIEAKKAEAILEEPMRKMLAGVLARENGVTVAEAAEAVPDLVDWFKLANRWHRPLVTDDPDELAKATRMIVAEHAAIIGAEVDHQAEAEMVDRLRREHPDAVLIARRRDGYYLCFVAHNDRTPWVHEHQISPTGRSRKDTPWQLIGLRWRKWRVLHTSAAWETWDHYTTSRDLLTDPEMEALAVSVIARYERDQDHGLLSIHLEQAPNNGEALRTHLGVARVDVPFEAIIAPNLLSETSTGPKVERRSIPWERRRSGEVHLLDERLDYRSHISDDRLVLHEDLPLINQVAAEQARLAEAEKVADHLRAKVRAAVASIHSQWDAFAVAAHYARFLEDFMDPELWEGHRQTIKIPTYPRSTRHDRDQLDALVASVIESGFEVHGRTVAEVIDLHRARIGPHTTQGGWGPRVNGASTWDPEATTVHDVAEGIRDDILDMVFGADE